MSNLISGAPEPHSRIPSTARSPLPAFTPLASPPLTREHLQKIERYYDSAPTESNWAGRAYRRLLARYYRHFIPPNASILEIGCGSGELLALLPNRDVTGIDLSEKQLGRARQRVPHGLFIKAAGEDLSALTSLPRSFDYIILSDTINFASDVQQVLEQARTFAGPHTRLVLNFYNAVWKPFLTLMTFLGLKSTHPAANWLSTSDVRNLLALSSWQLVKEDARILFPLDLPGFSYLFNVLLAPLFPWFGLTVFQVARPLPREPLSRKTVSVIIPARNESGNIRAAVERTPTMGAGTEIIFVEGNSTDDTWAEIQKIAREYGDRRPIKVLQQSGKGKGNAVREGFEAATGDILMILDADLTMPPEELPKFYEALATGTAEFANGVRLVYPMEERAMRFLNMCANKFFSLAFSWILGQSIKDTLCGTKVLLKSDYERIAANRAFFGEFDPFGDFDLLFGADKLNLRIVDIPIRYKERTYGETNIHRWSHGWLLLKMVFFSLRKIKFV